MVCGLRNGTVELWNINTLEKEMTLEDQEGSVQVDANDNVVAGVSSDSTVCIWDRKTGELKGKRKGFHFCPRVLQNKQRSQDNRETLI